MMKHLAVFGVVLCACSMASAAETNIEAPGPHGPLMGTLLSAEPGPVVLIIPGSGPTDRDGNNVLGVKGSSYRLLAEGLAERGISSVRIDKRGMFASAAAVADANAVTIADYVTDVRAWIGVIRQRTNAPCVWLLGHSEGGLVTLAAAQDPRDICGLVLVATPGRPLADVMREQLKSNPANAPILDQALSAIDALVAGKAVDATKLNPVLMPLFHPKVQKFLIDVFSYDPAVLLARYQGPVLILQGQRDIQVSERDARLLAAANSKATLVMLPDVNHVLKSVASDDRAANLATYANAGLPLATGVVDAIAPFVKAAR
jgi:alpha-beta hydrolase superfamily lysophospholipase